MKQVKFAVSRHFLWNAWEEWAEICHGDLSWPPSELIRFWSWAVDFPLIFATPGTNFSEVLTEIQRFSYKQMHFSKMSSAKCRPFCLGLDVLICFHSCWKVHHDCIIALFANKLDWTEKCVNLIPFSRGQYDGWWCGAQDPTVVGSFNAMMLNADWEKVLFMLRYLDVSETWSAERRKSVTHSHDAAHSYEWLTSHETLGNMRMSHTAGVAVSMGPKKQIAFSY